MPQGKYSLSDIEQPKAREQYSLADIEGAPTVPPAPIPAASQQPPTSFLGGIGRMIQADPGLNLITGAAKSAVTGIPLTISKLLGAVPPTTTPEELGMTPSNMTQSIGGAAERIGEFVYPAGRVAKLTSGFGLPARMLAEGVTAGGVGLAQGQSPGEASLTAATSGVLTGVGGILGPRRAPIINQWLQVPLKEM